MKLQEGKLFACNYLALRPQLELCSRLPSSSLSTTQYLVASFFIWLFYFLKNNLTMYLFMAALALRRCPCVFSSSSEQGLLSRCGERASRSGGVSCGAWAPGRCGFSCSTACGTFPDWTYVPCVGKWILNHWMTREVLYGYFLSAHICIRLTYLRRPLMSTMRALMSLYIHSFPNHCLTTFAT